jgi:NADH:ubiquinone oxidoreductase subunit H
MELAAAIILVLLVLVPAVVVLAMFVWAARKDGEADRDVQARLGIRRSKRLGR